MLKLMKSLLHKVCSWFNYYFCHSSTLDVNNNTLITVVDYLLIDFSTSLAFARSPGFWMLVSVKSKGSIGRSKVKQGRTWHQSTSHRIGMQTPPPATGQVNKPFAKSECCYLAAWHGRKLPPTSHFFFSFCIPRRRGDGMCLTHLKQFNSPELLWTWKTHLNLKGLTKKK